jgi:hypothetical protein
MNLPQQVFDLLMAHDRETAEALMTEYPGETIEGLVAIYFERREQWYKDQPELDDREPGAFKHIFRAMDDLAGRVQVTLHRAGISCEPPEVPEIMTGVVNLGLLGESDDLLANEDVGDQCAFAAEWLPEESQAFGDLVRGWQADDEFRHLFLFERVMVYGDDIDDSAIIPGVNDDFWTQEITEVAVNLFAAAFER